MMIIIIQKLETRFVVDFSWDWIIYSILFSANIFLFDIMYYNMFYIIYNLYYLLYFIFCIFIFHFTLIPIRKINSRELYPNARFDNDSTRTWSTRGKFPRDLLLFLPDGDSDPTPACRTWITLEIERERERERWLWWLHVLPQCQRSFPSSTRVELSLFFISDLDDLDRFWYIDYFSLIIDCDLELNLAFPMLPERIPVHSYFFFSLTLIRSFVSSSWHASSRRSDRD